MAETITIENQLHALIQKKEKLSTQLETLDADIAACQRVLNLVSPKGQKLNSAIHVTADQLRGKELEDALIYIAEKHHGLVNTYHTRPILIDAGVLKGDSEETSRHLNNALRKSKCFERADKNGRRGNWRLIKHSNTNRVVRIRV